MHIFSAIGNFLLSEWLWNVTRDWYHIPIAIILLFIAFCTVLSMRKMPALMLAISSQVYAFVVFSLFVISVFLYLFDFPYENTWVPHYLPASFYLGLIYSCLQYTFYLIVHQWYPLRITSITILTFICNALAAFLAYSISFDPLM